MILDVVPVIPPELRPMVQLDGGRFATSDLNDLYRRVINRNNRLKRLLDLGAPEIIVNNEKRMLQEAVDALFDNGRRGRPVTGPGNRPLKSLSDMLKGKQGRFRQNLLGKRVDYSGRSVIVVGPTLKLHQCGLPKLMALELFKPFVMKTLVDRELAQNIKSAKRMVERRRPQVWDVLEDVIKEHPVLLNRAPTLHRLGIQAFEPVLVEGKAIQVHPLVCTAFNADFDGDQMAVHLPLSAEAQAEARVLMLSSNNVLSPAHGRPLVTPTQDMIIGAFYLTETGRGRRGEGLRTFRTHGAGRARLRGRRRSSCTRRSYFRRPDLHDQRRPTARRPVEYTATTAGRLFFNRTLPEDFGYVNKLIRKKEMGEIVDRLASEFPKAVVARSLDAIKDLCFNFAMRSGLTISINDVKTPVEKAEILERHEAEADKVEKQFRRGIITDGERIQKEVEIWSEATTEVTKAMEDLLTQQQFNPIDMMVGSGARGNMMQVRQIAGMRGLVANPRGDMIPRPIKRNFREGLDGARVLHRHAGCPQGPRRHGAAYRRLGLPHPSSRRRRPGADHQLRGSVRGRPGAWPVDRRRRPARPRPSAPTSRPACSAACWPTTSRSPTARCPTPAPRSTVDADGRPCATTRRSPGSGCCRRSPTRASSASRRPATARRWPPARRSRSARPSASSPPSRSASPARSSRCGPSTPAVSPVRR